MWLAVFGRGSESLERIQRTWITGSGGGKSLVAGARIRPRLLERSPTPLPPSSRLPSRRSTKGRGGLVGRALEVELRRDRAADLRLHEPRLGLHGDVGGHFAGEVDEVVGPALHGP